MFGERLKKVRERKKLTQGEASKRMGIVRSTYANYENGKREPDNETLKKMAEFYEVSLDYLLGNDNNPLNNDQAKNDELMNILARLPQDKKELVIEVAKKFLTD